MRRKKEWRRADEIRDKLKRLGVTLEDTPRERFGDTKNLDFDSFYFYTYVLS